MNDREQAYELVASQPEISLDAATVREIVEEYNCDDSPHFLATVHLAERVIQLQRGLREMDRLILDSKYHEALWRGREALKGK